jgi:hypothetical protein
MNRIGLTFAMGIAMSTIFPSPARSGSGPALLDCAGSGARYADLRIQGMVPATEEDLKLVIEKGNRRFTLVYNDVRIVSVDAFNDKVYVLSITSDRTHEETTLHAIPSTMLVKELQNGIDAKFDARVTAPKPGLDHLAFGYDDYLHDVVVKCHYHHKI